MDPPLTRLSPPQVMLGRDMIFSTTVPGRADSDLPAPQTLVLRCALRFRSELLNLHQAAQRASRPIVRLLGCRNRSGSCSQDLERCDVCRANCLLHSDGAPRRNGYIPEDVFGPILNGSVGISIRGSDSCVPSGIPGHSNYLPMLRLTSYAGGGTGAPSPFVHPVKPGPAVYTYIIAVEDDSFRFSETRAALFVDLASRQALHANCAPAVRFKGGACCSWIWPESDADDGGDEGESDV
ncbi:hypothetical protein LXA43DRAFT_1067490 [Ganoderma leucocontextum]|nr:hypothetical protein LXA43DRAFT_1067487 [Ganoderma leucocontextum]KAI1783618.1 hypothetical protein LXA43DRAFT_1067490 [Ganoderma leucocontextum]